VLDLLTLFNVVERIKDTPAGADRIPFERIAIHWDRLRGLIADPEGALAASIGWGAPADAFQHEKLLDLLDPVDVRLRLRDTSADACGVDS
jgi:glucose/arabinose dehydrogenase